MSAAIDLSGKTAIVTGAASGIGRATAHLFANAGASLILGDRAEGVHETAKQVKEIGVAAKAVEIDAGAEEDVKGLVDLAIAEFGRLDICHANAGITGGVPGGLFDGDADLWSTVLRVNLIGPFLAIKHAAPKMAERGGGSIICTASVAGLRSGAGPAPYSASKAGVINLVQIAAQQLTGTNVRVNAVCPGLIETGMTKPLYEAARAKGVEGKIGNLNPLLRGGEPHEISGAVLFLASELSSYVNGQAIVVDGGLSSSLPVAPRERSRHTAAPKPV